MLLKGTVVCCGYGGFVIGVDWVVLSLQGVDGVCMSDIVVFDITLMGLG